MFLLCGLAAIGLVLALGSVTAGGIALIVVGAAGTGAVWAGVRYNRPSFPAPWWWLFASLASFTAAQLAYWYLHSGTGQPPPFPSVVDGLLFAHTLMLLVGLSLAVRARDEYGSREGIVDAAILTLVLVVVKWRLVLEPFFAPLTLDASAFVAVGYSIFAILAFAIGVRLALKPEGRGASLWLLVAGLGVWLCGVLAYSLLVLLARYDTDHPLAGLLLLAPVLLGAAALHPASDRLTAPREVGRPWEPQARAGLLAVAIVSAAAVMLATQSPFASSDVPFWALFVLLALLVVVRMALVERRYSIARSHAVDAQKLQDLGRLAGSIAHDFNNLMTVVLGFGEMVKDKVADRPGVDADLDEMLNAARHAATLTDQLLAFTRWEHDEVEVLDLQELLETNIVLLRRLAGERMELRLQPCPRALWVRISPARAVQVLVNLVANARDATQGVGSATIGCAVEDATAVITVRDEGPGIPPEAIGRIFDPFYTTKKAAGTGLGLPIVRRIVLAAEGTVDVDSRPGTGTTFTIRLPLVDHVPVETTTAPAARHAGPAHVLLVEDQQRLRRLIVTTLERQGYQVRQADSAETAQAIVTDLAVPIDLLITDILLPGAPGTELARTAHEHRPALPVLFISGYPGEERSVDTSSTRTAFLAKPFTPTDLTAAAQRLLEDT